MQNFGCPVSASVARTTLGRLPSSMTDVHAGSYKEAIIFLVTAGVVVPLFHRLRISPVLGFIGAGAILGPFGLGRLADTVPWVSIFTIGNRSEIAHLAEFGVIFLMFMIGVELSWERLRTLRRLVFGLGSAQVLASSLVIGIILFALEVPLAASVIVGLALALSSTAVVLPVLAEQKRLNTPAGRASFAVLLFQDLAVAPMLFAIAVLGRSDGADVGGRARPRARTGGHRPRPHRGRRPPRATAPVPARGPDPLA